MARQVPAPVPAADAVVQPASRPGSAPAQVWRQPRLWLGGVAIAALLILAAVAWHCGWSSTAPAPPRLSPVVLPFENPSGDPAQDYLADAVTDGLTTDLSHIPDALVIARKSAHAYKGKPEE